MTDNHDQGPKPAGQVSGSSGSRALYKPETWKLLKRAAGLLESPRQLVVFVALLLVASVAEAAVIVFVVSGAAAVVSGNAGPTVDVGPIVVTLQLSVVLWLAGTGTVVLVAAKLAAGALSARMGSTVLGVVRERVVAGLLAASWAEQAQVTASRFQDLVSEQAFRMANLVGHLSSLLTALVAFVAMLATALLVEPLIAALLLLVGGVLMVVFRPVTRRVRRLSFQMVDVHHRYLDRVANLFGVLPEIRIYDVRDTARERHGEINREAVDQYQRVRFAQTVQPALYLGVVMLLLTLGLAALGARATTDLAVVGATVLVLLRGLRYSQQAQGSWQRAAELLPFMIHYETVLNAWRGDGRPWGDTELRRARTLQLRDVGYVYPSGEIGLRDVSVTIEHGRIVGLVGPSGAGKSTLAQILLGLRGPTSGEYVVDGMPHSAFDERSWFSRFAYVAQQPVLLEGTVADNVRFLRDGVDEDAVAAAMSGAALDRDPSLSGPLGAAREVGSGGTELSGGQRQRVAIARALVGQPDVLVLDEPTSALDPDAEQVFLETLERLRGQLTIVLIAHRESTLRVCDQVVTMHAGRIVSIDDHESGRSSVSSPPSAASGSS